MAVGVGYFDGLAEDARTPDVVVTVVGLVDAALLDDLESTRCESVVGSIIVVVIEETTVVGVGASPSRCGAEDVSLLVQVATQ